MINKLNEMIKQNKQKWDEIESLSSKIKSATYQDSQIQDIAQLLSKLIEHFKPLYSMDTKDFDFKSLLNKIKK